MILVDWQIRNLCCNLPDGALPMIDPFSEAVSGDGVISWGCSHAGYDIRLGPDILIFKNSYGEVLDPKKFSDPAYRNRCFDQVSRCDRSSRDDTCANCLLDKSRCDKTPVIIPAHSYILGHSYEYLRIPRNLKARCVGKSTLARVGMLINTTPAEPGWHGHLTIEIANITSCPMNVHVMEGISQLEFEELSALPEVDYADKKGVYQGQIGVTTARVL